jgi:glutathione S-transferase
MIKLHHSPGTASMIPHIVLQEMGVPFELVLVDRENQAHRGADYLAINPNGLIPALVQSRAGRNDLVLYETAAICLYLCDTHPEAKLAPVLGTPERAHFYKWLMWLTNTLQAALILYFYPERYVAPGNASGALEVKAQAQARIGGYLAQLDDELGRVKLRSKASDDVAGLDDWFMGAHYTVLDPYVFTLCRWTRNFSSHPARSYPNLGPYLQRMLARPAVQRVLTSEGINPPLV